MDRSLKNLPFPLEGHSARKAEMLVSQGFVVTGVILSKANDGHAHRVVVDCGNVRWAGEKEWRDFLYCREALVPQLREKLQAMVSRELRERPKRSCRELNEAIALLATTGGVVVGDVPR